MYNNISNEILHKVSNEIILKFGLNFPKNRFGDLKRYLVNASNLKKMDVNSYIELFLAKKLSIEEYRELANCLTIGETYFFRDKKLFDVLRKNILPDLIEAKRYNKTITFWSSGCSSGEEAYSIAILIREILRDVDQWNINIIATDINLNSLNKARQGVYSEWSFRETDIMFKNLYFDKIDCGKYKLKDEIKESVKFSYLNLADEIYVADNNLIQGVDIIFCRNVLMYFSESQAKNTISKYYKILNDKGWLIVAPSEGLFLNKTSFMPINVNETFLYSKNEENKGNESDFNILEFNEFKNEFEDVEEIGIKCEEINKEISEIGQVETLDYKVDYEEQCRIKANEGNLQEALAICKKAINQNKINPIYYYLLASIEQELGNIKAAIDALKKAIYLDSNFVMAYFDLGNLFLKLGKNKEALKFFNNVSVLLQHASDEEIIPNTEAVTVGMLKHFVVNILNENHV